ncbi:MAG: GTPase-associated system all-helical protein GASH [Nannocystaceae bacterium]
MLKKTFDWYRLVDIEPNSATIDRRTRTARDIVCDFMGSSSEYSDGVDATAGLASPSGWKWPLIFSCAVGVIAGFDNRRVGQSAPITARIINGIRAHDSAFPSEISENGLELRACGAVVLGELLQQCDGESPSAAACTLAAVLHSGLGVRPPVTERYLAQMLSELGVYASSTLHKGGLSRREPEALSDMDGLESHELEYSDVLRGIVRQSRIDREELNILWWMFAGASISTGRPLPEMSDGAAAFACAVELSRMCLVPPVASLEALVKRAFESGRKPKSTTKMVSLEELTREWDDSLLKTPDEKSSRLAARYPALLPLSWVVERVRESGGTSGWMEDFERITGMSATDRTARFADWAVQILRELVAIRLVPEGQA